MSLTVVIPVFNHVADTIVTLDTLEATTRCDVVIVDDGSTDATREVIGKRRVTYITNPHNLGVNASWNVGIRSAISGGARYVCVANNDLAFSPGWWPPLQAALDSGMAVVSPYSTEGMLPTDWPYGVHRHENPHGLPILGSCFAFRPGLVERIGQFPEAMRHYYGDNWIADACADLGLRVGFVRDSYVHHFYMQTSSALPHEQLIADGEAYKALRGAACR